jgi:aldose 1-epimerase
MSAAAADMPRGQRGASAVHSLLTLRAGALELRVAPHIGGAIAAFFSLGSNGVCHWLRPADGASLLRGDPHGMASFPLVPFASRIRNGCLQFEGRAHRLRRELLVDRHALHGNAWRGAWAVEAHAERFARLSFESDGAGWPAPFRAVQQFELSAEGLTQTLSVENRGCGRMPLGLGVHPYLPRPPGTQLKTCVQQMCEVDAELLPTGRWLRPPALEALRRGADVDALLLDNSFCGWSRRAEVAWADERRLMIHAEPPLELLAIFAPRGAPYFCVEPVSNAPDWINRPDLNAGGAVLEPGQTQIARCHFRPFDPEEHAP